MVNLLNNFIFYYIYIMIQKYVAINRPLKLYIITKKHHIKTHHHPILFLKEISLNLQVLLRKFCCLFLTSHVRSLSLIFFTDQVVISSNFWTHMTIFLSNNNITFNRSFIPSVKFLKCAVAVERSHYSRLYYVL